MLLLDKLRKLYGVGPVCSELHIAPSTPEPPPRARMRCVDVGGNPPVYQRDREKDKDRKTN